MAVPLFPDCGVVIGCDQQHRRAGYVASGDECFGEGDVAHDLVCSVAEPAAERDGFVSVLTEHLVVAAAVLAVVVGELEAAGRVTTERSRLRTDRPAGVVR